MIGSETILGFYLGREEKLDRPDVSNGILDDERDVLGHAQLHKLYTFVSCFVVGGISSRNIYEKVIFLKAGRESLMASHLDPGRERRGSGKMHQVAEGEDDFNRLL